MQSSALPSPDELFRSLARGRSIMQEAEALAGPSFPLTSSAPSSREVLSTGLCTWTSEAPLSSGHQAANIPKKGTLEQFQYLLRVRDPLGYRHKGTMCTWANPEHRNSCHRTRVQETSQLVKVPSSTPPSRPRVWGVETQENKGVRFGCE